MPWEWIQTAGIALGLMVLGIILWAIALAVFFYFFTSSEHGNQPLDRKAPSNLGKGRPETNRKN
jgi:hypothetical protein